VFPILLSMDLAKSREFYHETLGLEILAGGKPRAVFAGNDHLALGLLHAISEAGLRVPEDIAVIGFDDVLWSGLVRASAIERAAGFPGNR